MLTAKVDMHATWPNLSKEYVLDLKNDLNIKIADMLC